MVNSIRRAMAIIFRPLYSRFFCRPSSSWAQVWANMNIFWPVEHCFVTRERSNSSNFLGKTFPKKISQYLLSKGYAKAADWDFSCNRIFFAKIFTWKISKCSISFASTWWEGIYFSAAIFNFRERKNTFLHCYIVDTIVHPRVWWKKSATRS